MSFGFSISDLVCCGQLAWQLYCELNDAAGECQAFAKELLLLHQVILRTENSITRTGDMLDDAQQATLRLCVDMCQDVLFVQVAGVDCTFVDLDRGHVERPTLSTEGELKQRPVLSQTDYGERSFAKRIPKIRSAILTLIEKLTSLQVLVIQSLQIDNRDILHELREFQVDAAQHLREKTIHVESATERLEQGQARMEAQMRALLESQQRNYSGQQSYSLDASSPEGRQIWMDLGRLLRAQGITPAMIKQNRELLVRAMKNSLEDFSPAQSYRTAPQSFEGDDDCMGNAQSRQLMTKSSTSASTSLLGSAPILGATFSREFLDRHNGAARSLDKDQNVQKGMKSLLEGIDTEDQADIGNGEEGEAIDMQDM